MRLFLFFLFTAFLAVESPVYACSPVFDDRPLAMKLAGDNFFIGKVEYVTDTKVKFSVITPGGPAKDKRKGDTASFKLEKDTGTCGRRVFKVGEIWLYDGSIMPLTPAMKLDPFDIKDGMDMKTVKDNIVARLDPSYKPPVPPAKEDMPVPGTYSATQECGIPLMAKQYTLKISEPDPATGKYKVNIDAVACGKGIACAFSGEAPPYGYGEIIVPMSPQEQQGCSIIVQQLSGVDEWPRIKEGQALVRVNKPGCSQSLKICAFELDSPILQKTGE